MKLFVFGFPGEIGGADTKMTHTLPLWTEIADQVTCIANAPNQITPENKWTKYLDSLGISYCLKEDIKCDPGDIALSLCNPFFFKQGFCEYAKEIGLKVIWSSEMMWHHDKELECVKKGMVDKVLYVSDIQKQKLTYPDDMPWSITGNYIDESKFPYKMRTFNYLNIGRLSREDSYKYTENFPIFYEEMIRDIPPNKIHFLIMAWDKILEDKYKWHNFDRRWTFFTPMQMDTLAFLYKLNVFAYPLGHNFVESWGRSTVEAMLTGCIPITFSGHHLDNLIDPGVSGFIADDIGDWRNIMSELFNNPIMRVKLGKQAAECAREFCNREHHIEIWKTALHV